MHSYVTYFILVAIKDGIYNIAVICLIIKLDLISNMQKYFALKRMGCMRTWKLGYREYML